MRRKYNGTEGQTSAQSEAADAENELGRVLKSGGRSVKKITGPKGDLLIDGSYFLEVKTAKPQHPNDEDIKWAFNIHRHGKLEELCDYYLFRFEDVPGCKKPLYAAFRSPLNCLTIQFSLRKMLYTLGPAMALFEDLRDGRIMERTS
jgi:hypothetical protein